jgi:hypothetical protein
MYLTVEDSVRDDGVLPLLEEILGEEQFNLFSWQEGHDGRDVVVTAVLRDLVSAQVFAKVQEALDASPMVIKSELLRSLSSEAEPGVADSPQADTYDSDWYWPLDKRLPRSDYKNPKAIRIAQADTGVSPQPNLVGGFKQSESMSFFFPKGQREGKGVVCWGESHALFASHGTGTGGLMIGQPAGDLPLHGMTLRDVVQLVPCLVADSVLLIPSDLERLAECIDWAVDHDIKVVNISLGAIAADKDRALTPLTRAVERAYKSGLILCCASGQLALGMVWPGIYSMKGWAICCGPSNQKQEPSAQSIWPMFKPGYVTVAAPGEYMPRAAWKGDICSNHEPELMSSEGSSYSTAYTSSVAALWWALNYETLSNMNPRDIVPTFRHTLATTSEPWHGSYGPNYGPGIVNPNALLRPVTHPQDYSLECKDAFRVKSVPGGTYRDVTLHAHSSGSIHAEEPVFVEGKLTLISESSGTILIPATVICRELEIRCSTSAHINTDDLEFYDSCILRMSSAGVCNLYMAAEGPISGDVKEVFTVLKAWIYWRHGRKPISINNPGNWAAVDIDNYWGGRWA